MDENISTLIGAAKDDEQVALTGKDLRAYAAEVAEKAKKESEEAYDRKYAEAVRSQMPDTMRSMLKANGITVGEDRSAYKAYASDTRAAGAGLIIRALAATKSKPWQETQECIRAWVKAVPTPEGEAIVRAMQEQDFDSGGALVQALYSTEIIGLLRSISVVRQAGARVIPMPGGNLTIGKITGGSTAFYRGEGEAVNASKLKTGQLVMSQKELIGRVAISNRLLKHASLAMDIIARDDLFATIGEKEDITFLRSPGGQHSPKGMRYLADPNHVQAAVNTTSPTVAQVRADLAKPTLALKRANIAMRMPTWFIAPGTEEFLMSLVDGNGNPVYEKEMVENKTIRRIPYFMSTQIPENLGGSGDATDITLVDMAEIFIGEEGPIEARVDTDVSYHDGSGNLVSAYANDETVVQVVQFQDFGSRYDKAIYILKDVRWTM